MVFALGSNDDSAPLHGYSSFKVRVGTDQSSEATGALLEGTASSLNGD